MSASDRLLGLIDAAYDIAASPVKFDNFLNEAQNYLFDRDQSGRIARDVRHQTGNDPSLDSHTDRIRDLVTRAFAQRSETADRHHAILIVNSTGTVISGNPAAKQLMSSDFPCALQDLPLDHATVQTISKNQTQGARDDRADKIVLATVESTEPKSCLALIQRHSPGDGMTQVSVSYIDWSPHLISRLGKAFDLTKSETEILEGYLRKSSQKEIANLRERSLQTVKVQSKAILRKTGCARMSDVVQLSAGIAYLLRQMPDPEPVTPMSDWVTPKTGMGIIQRPGGRRVAWYRVGSGLRPVLFVHGLVQGPFFPADFVDAISHAGFYLICPSRPGFGYTDPSTSRETYNQTCSDDVLAVLDHVGVSNCTVFGHQGGSSHAFRLAKALGERCNSMLIVDGGVPLNEAEDFDSIEPNSRLLAAAARRSPSLLKLITRLSKAVYRKWGVEPLMRKTYGASTFDSNAMKNPGCYSVLAAGFFHVGEQKSEIWVRDGAAAMEDWSADFECDCARQVWVQAEHSKTLAVEVVMRGVKKLPRAELRVIPDAGNTLLYTHPHDVVIALTDVSS